MAFKLDKKLRTFLVGRKIINITDRGENFEIEFDNKTILKFKIKDACGLCSIVVANLKGKCLWSN